MNQNQLNVITEIVRNMLGDYLADDLANELTEEIEHCIKKNMDRIDSLAGEKKKMSAEEKSNMAEMVRKVSNKYRYFWVTSAFYWLGGNYPDMKLDDALDIIHSLREDDKSYPFSD